ncbi:MAG: ornithine--oxo-acid transaminase [Vulcanimicrobiaceae bacterium]|jgi:ornithine--oxo-acid transaminase
MPSQASDQPAADALVTIEDEFGAHNYDPIDVVLTSGEGIWVTDVDGATYIDALSAYSSLNLGHRHPRIIAALTAQAERLAITSRAFRNDQLPLFCEELAKLCGLDVVLPMNTGTEAVETAIKAARRWGVRVKKIKEPKIVVCENNFHGRSTTIIGFSSDESYRRDFGPFTPGFVSIPYDDIAALEKALTDDVCAFLVEPIQAEAGIIVPKTGYMRAAADLCKERGVLFVADEIQTGLARTGKLFALDYDDVKPDLLILGKALGGGVYPVSAVVGRREVMEVFDPGSHGSTWGGNPLACAIAREALRVIADENLAQVATERGDQLTYEMVDMRSRNIVEIRGQGLLLGIELKVPARKYCEALAKAGVLTKETHSHVIRICPPLIISEDDIEELAERIAEGFAAAESG